MPSAIRLFFRSIERWMSEILTTAWLLLNMDLCSPAFERCEFLRDRDHRCTVTIAYGVRTRPSRGRHTLEVGAAQFSLTPHHVAVGALVSDVGRAVRLLPAAESAPARDAGVDGRGVGTVTLRRQLSKFGGYAAKEGPLKAGRAQPIDLDQGTVEALRAQRQQPLADAAKSGEAWVATGYVFTREDGLPWHPDILSQTFDKAVAAASVPRIRLHDLRHTWATVALRAGVHVKVVQERLGHASIKTTMDTDSHVLPGMQRSAAELVAALVDGAGEVK